MLKVCFIGLGSIGKRHFRNLVIILKERKQEYVIDAVRSRRGGLPEDIEEILHTQYEDTEQLPEGYDIIFITNPTVCHYDTILKVAHCTRHLFIEKPVFREYKENISALMLSKDGIYYVACPMRYSPVLTTLKERLENEKVYSVRAISSSYLPGWRKGVDYREIYSAHREMGGGVTLDLIHELDYIVWLFGMPERSLHISGKYSDLETDSDDLAVYLLQYPELLAEIHIDYFGRENVREIEFFCRDYVIKGDLIRNILKYVYPDGREEEVELPAAQNYISEMNAFLDMTEGRRNNFNDIRYANQVLRLALEEA